MMRTSGTLRVLGAALVVVSWTSHGVAGDVVVSAVDAQWEILVPSGRFGRFDLSVERTEFDGTVAQVASRLARAWATDPWPVLADDGATGSGLSRLTPAGIETIWLRSGESGRIEARRSVLEWRGQPAGSLADMPDFAFVRGLRVLGEPLPGLASVDGDAGNQTRAWLVPGDVEEVSRLVEQVAARHRLSPLLRFNAPADVSKTLSGGRVLAFGGADAVAVVTFNRNPAGVAVVVHCQERLP